MKFCSRFRNLLRIKCTKLYLDLFRFNIFIARYTHQKLLEYDNFSLKLQLKMLRMFLGHGLHASVYGYCSQTWLN